jgi:GNAT superfamily N-acetyltransferase
MDSGTVLPGMTEKKNLLNVNMPLGSYKRRKDMEIRDATIGDFDIAFDYIEKLWTYNTYDREKIRTVYEEVLENPNDFAFFIFDGGKPMGFCHGTFFNTFWLSGQTCYVSSIISNEEVRGKGYGIKLMDHAKRLAEERGCHALVLDSGMPRTAAHRFYEIYGFEKCAYCFEYKLHD